jgi:hypothetical protein
LSTARPRRERFSYLCSGRVYQANVFEHRGKKADAVNAPQEFLSHFENSNARLPQIAEARAALKRLFGGVRESCSRQHKASQTSVDAANTAMFAVAPCRLERWLGRRYSWPIQALNYVLEGGQVYMPSLIMTMTVGWNIYSQQLGIARLPERRRAYQSSIQEQSRRDIHGCHREVWARQIHM